MNPVEQNSRLNEYYPTAGKKAGHFFIGFLIVAAVFGVSALFMRIGNNLNTLVIGLLLDGVASLAIIIIGAIMMRNQKRRFIGIGLLVTAILPLTFLLIATGGCGLFYRR